MKIDDATKFWIASRRQFGDALRYTQVPISYAVGYEFHILDMGNPDEIGVQSG